jgi:hypothetical protein
MAHSVASPWWRLTSRMVPAHLAPGGEATIYVQAINVGNTSASGPGAFSDVLPAHLALKEEEIEGVLLPEVSFSTSSSGDLSRAEFLFHPLHFCSVSGQRVTCQMHSPNPASWSRRPRPAAG